MNRELSEKTNDFQNHKYTTRVLSESLRGLSKSRKGFSESWRGFSKPQVLEEGAFRQVEGVFKKSEGFSGN